MAKKRKIPSEILKESGTVIHFKLLFSSQNGKTWKIQPEFFKFRAWVPVVSVMISLLFSASLHWHCYFYENGPLLVGFRCCKCVFALLNFWSDSRDTAHLIWRAIFTFLTSSLLYDILLSCKKSKCMLRNTVKVKIFQLELKCMRL